MPQDEKKKGKSNGFVRREGGGKGGGELANVGSKKRTPLVTLSHRPQRRRESSPTGILADFYFNSGEERLGEGIGKEQKRSPPELSPG